MTSPLSRFEVLDKFRLESKDWYVVPGTILEGVLEVGQLGYFESEPSLTFRIRAIEFVLVSATQGTEHPALIFSQLSRAQLDLLQSLQPGTCFITSSSHEENKDSDI